VWDFLQEVHAMAKKTPSHSHKRSEPSQHTSAPNKAQNTQAPGRSGMGTQDRDGETGQFTGAGDPPLMKK
jgi:hypothetical protein